MANTVEVQTARCSAVMSPRTYDACWNDLERFKRSLAAWLSERFVLSFGYSTIYAVRDKNGFRLLRPGVELEEPVNIQGGDRCLTDFWPAC